MPEGASLPGRRRGRRSGPINITITIMVLELKVPHEPTLEALGGSVNGFLTCLLSFVYIGI